MLFLRLSRCCCFLKATTTRWYPSKTLSLVSKKRAAEKRWLRCWCRWNATGPCSGRAGGAGLKGSVWIKKGLWRERNTQRESTKNAAKSKQDFSAGARRALVSFTNEVSRFFSRARRVRLSLVVGFCFTSLDDIISLFLRIYYLCRFVLNL